MISDVKLTVHSVENKKLTDQLLSKSCNYPHTNFFGYTVDQTLDEVTTSIIKAFDSGSLNITAVNRSCLVVECEISVNEKAFAIMYFSSRSKYTSVNLQIWGSSLFALNVIRDVVVNCLHPHSIEGIICGMRWVFSSREGLETVYLEELIDDVVFDESYPDICNKYGSLEKFVDAFLESDESVLVLQGPPGTGKSRLLRYLLARLVVQQKAKIANIDIQNGPALSSSTSNVLYTSDESLFKTDSLFARFVTEQEKIMIVEDADHILKPRSNGNDVIHRFLTVSDGIFRSTGKKIVFTSNLPNIGDLDAALSRKGRCFAHLMLRSLTAIEANVVSRKLTQTGPVVFFGDGRYTLADVYSRVKNSTVVMNVDNVY